MDQEGYKMDQKRLKYMKKGFLDQNTCSLRNLFSRILGTLPPKQKLVSQTKLAALVVTICIWKIWTLLKTSRKLAVIWKNPESFGIIRKIGSHLESPDSFETIRKIGSHLEKSQKF